MDSRLVQLFFNAIGRQRSLVQVISSASLKLIGDAYKGGFRLNRTTTYEGHSQINSLRGQCDKRVAILLTC